jgi:hypothetical protein
VQSQTNQKLYNRIYTPRIHMKDIFNANVVCNKCNTQTKKKLLEKEGFTIRFFECPKCNEKWYHPTDMKEYQEFRKLKDRIFKVKLRMVGNSFSVTIPKEIINFEEKFLQMEKEMDNMINLCLDTPNRLSLHFQELR